MSITLFSASQPVFRNALTNLHHLLEKARADAATRGYDPQVLVSYRLAPDMLPFKSQVFIACDAAKLCMARLGGLDALQKRLASDPNWNGGWYYENGGIPATLEQIRYETLLNYGQGEAEAKVARAERARQMAEEKKVKEAQREKQAEQQRLEAISREAAQKAARDARYAARKQRIR